MTHQSYNKNKFQQQCQLNFHQRSSTPEIFQHQSPGVPARSSTPQLAFYNQNEPQRSPTQRPNYFNCTYRDTVSMGYKPQSITPPEKRPPPILGMRRPMTPNNDLMRSRYKHSNEINSYQNCQISQLAQKESFQRNLQTREQCLNERTRDRELELIKALKNEIDYLKRENSQLKREKENSNEEKNQIYYEKYQAMNLLNQESRENERLRIELAKSNAQNNALRDELNELRGQHLVSRRMAICETGYTRSIEDKYYIAPLREQFEVPSKNVSAMNSQYPYAVVEEMHTKPVVDHEPNLMRIANEVKSKEQFLYSQSSSDMIKLI